MLCLSVFLMLLSMAGGSSGASKEMTSEAANSGQTFTDFLKSTCADYQQLSGFKDRIATSVARREIYKLLMERGNKHDFDVDRDVFKEKPGYFSGGLRSRICAWIARESVSYRREGRFTLFEQLAALQLADEDIKKKDGEGHSFADQLNVGNYLDSERKRAQLKFNEIMRIYIRELVSSIVDRMDSTKPDWIIDSRTTDYLNAVDSENIHGLKDVTDSDVVIETLLDLKYTDDRTFMEELAFVDKLFIHVAVPDKAPRDKCEDELHDHGIIKGFKDKVAADLAIKEIEKLEKNNLGFSLDRHLFNEKYEITKTSFFFSPTLRTRVCNWIAMQSTVHKKQGRHVLFERLARLQQIDEHIKEAEDGKDNDKDKTFDGLYSGFIATTTPVDNLLKGYFTELVSSMVDRMKRKKPDWLNDSSVRQYIVKVDKEHVLRLHDGVSNSDEAKGMLIAAYEENHEDTNFRMVDKLFIYVAGLPEVKCTDE
eukprot:GHVU01078700.1.p1 GENE.GHVU01078700.1~~GHVU01078700.1.p1  ORF type:complete len:482 (-),score=54.50 GHVU01078700.1:1917-3362(-)